MNSNASLTKVKTPPAAEEKPSYINDPWFRRLYIAAIQGLHAGFEQVFQDSGEMVACVYFDHLDKDAIARSKHFAAVAWNSACEAFELFEAKEAEIFNKKLANKK